MGSTAKNKVGTPRRKVKALIEFDLPEHVTDRQFREWLMWIIGATAIDPCNPLAGADFSTDIVENITMSRDVTVLGNAAFRGVPIFTLSARDQYALKALATYLNHMRGDGKVSEDFARQVQEKFDQFFDYYHDPGKEVKVPD